MMIEFYSDGNLHITMEEDEMNSARRNATTETFLTPMVGLVGL